MNAENIALCRFYRNPPGGQPALSYAKIAQLVKKIDGTRPTKQGVYNALQNMNATPSKRGRKVAWRKTTKNEDSSILKTFKRLRPDGHGIDSRTIHKHLPTKLRRKVERRTVIRRLAEKGYVPKKKIAKTDTGPTHRAARLAFAE